MLGSTNSWNTSHHSYPPCCYSAISFIISSEVSHGSGRWLVLTILLGFLVFDEYLLFSLHLHILWKYKLFEGIWYQLNQWKCDDVTLSRPDFNDVIAFSRVCDNIIFKRLKFDDVTSRWWKCDYVISKNQVLMLSWEFDDGLEKSDYMMTSLWQHQRHI